MSNNLKISKNRSSCYIRKWLEYACICRSQRPPSNFYGTRNIVLLLLMIDVRQCCYELEYTLSQICSSYNYKSLPQIIKRSSIRCRPGRMRGLAMQKMPLPMITIQKIIARFFTSLRVCITLVENRLPGTKRASHAMQSSKSFLILLL